MNNLSDLLHHLSAADACESTAIWWQKQEILFKKTAPNLFKCIN